MLRILFFLLWSSLMAEKLKPSTEKEIEYFTQTPSRFKGKVKTQPRLTPYLKAIREIESGGGQSKYLLHSVVPRSHSFINHGQRAGGEFGNMPTTVRDTIQHFSEKAKRLYPEIRNMIKEEHKLLEDMFKRAGLKKPIHYNAKDWKKLERKNPELFKEFWSKYIANSDEITKFLIQNPNDDRLLALEYEKYINKFKDDPYSKAAAWYHGPGFNTDDIKKIKNLDYVKKFEKAAENLYKKDSEAMKPLLKAMAPKHKEYFEEQKKSVSKELLDLLEQNDDPLTINTVEDISIEKNKGLPSSTIMNSKGYESVEDKPGSLDLKSNEDVINKNVPEKLIAPEYLDKPIQVPFSSSLINNPIDNEMSQNNENLLSNMEESSSEMMDDLEDPETPQANQLIKRLFGNSYNGGGQNVG